MTGVMSALIASMIVVAAVAAQATPVPPETKQFAFWIGKWNCEGDSYAADGTKSHTKATNEIRWAMDGHVVEENFSGAGMVGRSLSVYMPAGKKWRQTWVDNQGSYIALVGGFADGKMTLQTVPNPASPNTASRMVFSKIQKDSFDWDWEATTDGGKTWKLSWHLHYTRRK